MESLNELNIISVLGITNRRILKRFYKQWSMNASKLLSKYTSEHSSSWFNTKWRKNSRDIKFYIRNRPKSNMGNVWFTSQPTNYAYHKSVKRFKLTSKIIPKSTKIKHIYAYNKWFTPHKYRPDINNINKSLISDIYNNGRFFVSNTSKNKSRKYKRPLLWFASNKDNTVRQVNLKEQLSDIIADNQETYNLLYDAFNMTLQQLSK